MSEIGPVRAAERLDALDVVRGFALCGILLMNIPAMGQTFLSGPPLGFASWGNPSWVTWLVQKLFFEGSMRGLFTLLFGAGILFMTRKAAGPDGPVAVADVFYRRCLCLIALGLANVLVLIWPGDILYFYGISGLFLFVFRRSRPLTLVILSLAVVLVSTGALLAASAPRLEKLYAAEQVDRVLAKPNHPALTKTQLDALKARDDLARKFNPTPKELSEETHARQSGWPGVVGWAYGAWAEFALGPFGLFGGIMESVAFMMLGMALFKWKVLTGERSLAFYGVMAGVGFVLAMGLRGLSAWLTWSFDGHPHLWISIYQNAIYEFGRLPLTLFWLGVVAGAWKLLPAGFFAPLRALGKMALTNYLGQSLITSILFYGFHLYGVLNWAQLWGVAAAIWVAEAIFSQWWLTRFEMGPMEWVLRSVTYMSWQPMGREKSGGGAPTLSPAV
jgi:uncharacterized protein